MENNSPTKYHMSKKQSKWKSELSGDVNANMRYKDLCDEGISRDFIALNEYLKREEKLKKKKERSKYVSQEVKE